MKLEGAAFVERGALIVVEGIDGTGKTTFARKLCGLMNEKGIETVYTYEPTEGSFGRKLRHSFTSSKRLAPADESRLFMLDRQEHVKDFILPSLYAGKSVVCDRYYFSTMAYQGARGLDMAHIFEENSRFAPDPDMLFMLELEPEDAVRRITGSRGERQNSFEQTEYLEKVAALFQMINMPFLSRLDASCPENRLVSEAWRHINQRYGAVLS